MLTCRPANTFERLTFSFILNVSTNAHPNIGNYEALTLIVVTLSRRVLISTRQPRSLRQDTLYLPQGLASGPHHGGILKHNMRLFRGHRQVSLIERSASRGALIP